MFILDFIRKTKLKHRNYSNEPKDKKINKKDTESKLPKFPPKQSTQNRKEALLTLTF